MTKHPLPCADWMAQPMRLAVMTNQQVMRSKMVSKAVTSAQTRVEGNNFDSRKNVLKYDDVIRRQREIFYEQRMQVVKVKELETLVKGMMRKAIEDVCYNYSN